MAPRFRKENVLFYHIAKERGTAFLAASDYVCADDADSEHMNEDGHRIFASVLYEKLKEMKVI